MGGPARPLGVCVDWPEGKDKLKCTGTAVLQEVLCY